MQTPRLCRPHAHALHYVKVYIYESYAKPLYWHKSNLRGTNMLGRGQDSLVALLGFAWFESA